MGVQDRDWYIDAQREREKQGQLDKTRGKFSTFSRKHFSAKPHQPRQIGLIPMLIFWCAVMGLLYFLMNHYIKPKQVKVLTNGTLVIERARDNHFYIDGHVNGQKVRFMVDTGASMVTVSENLAQKANINGGRTTTFNTANGPLQGRIVDGVGIALGPVRVSNVRVGVGLYGFDVDEALLGQSILSKFDISIQKNQMFLRPR